MDPIKFQSKFQEISENTDPNISHSAKENPKPDLNPIPEVSSPRNRIRERRFLVVKKKKESSSVESRVSEVDCKCGAKSKGNFTRCVCAAYETLRASQEEFFKIPTEVGESSENDDGMESDEIAVATMKRIREEVLEEARMNIPEYGKVMHLVKAFEKLTCFPLSKVNQNKGKVKKWELPGMNQPNRDEDQQVTWSSSFSASDLVLTATSLGLEESHASVSLSGENSVSSQNSNCVQRSRSNSLESAASVGSRISRKKLIRVTSPKPFKLRTEQRGRMKEEEFTKKLQEMMLEEGKMRIHIAQGLPYTTDEPENLVKPPVKDITIPVDLKLHSDIRAVERAEFDYQVAEKTNLIEHYKGERKRQQKLTEKEELRRLRKEMIPKAQPMPYFDRPFIPKRSNKHPTIPREPKFNIPQHKKIRCCSTSSWSETGSYTSDFSYQQDL